MDVKDLSDRQLTVKMLEIAREIARRQRSQRKRNLSDDELLHPKRHKAVQRNNTSGAKGVTLNKSAGKWQAKISSKHLGYFATVEEAIAARTAAEREHWGK